MAENQYIYIDLFTIFPVIIFSKIFLKYLFIYELDIKILTFKWAQAMQMPRSTKNGL